MKVKMAPSLSNFKHEESGIKRVLEYYYKYLPDFGIELIEGKNKYDVLASHAATNNAPDVLHTHGLYWTADYPAAAWEWEVNKVITQAARYAKFITVPSEWVAETFRRDMHINPVVVHHGIEINQWKPKKPSDYILWNKNRDSDVCDPWAIEGLARKFQSSRFVTTFAPKPTMSGSLPDNIVEIGLQKHFDMKLLLQESLVYLATTKETFGIGTLEAMACGVPILGFAHGGNLDIVEHCVNGYLATPGDIDDLIRGLDYCVTNRDILGRNSRELAAKWSWRHAAEIVAGVYCDCMVEEKPTVSVVIPCYNYSESLGRTIQSVKDQDYPFIDSIVVVDDGSRIEEQDRIKNVVDSFGANIHLIRQDNAGVAIARNTGISHGYGKYVCCIDSDDAIEPSFISTCVDALEKDRSLGIAYTGLWWIKPDGSEGKSQWPEGFDYDQQVNRRNQIPTCCVYRRTAWERTGGYRQRYAPNGAGNEDAEFWLRIGALGFNAKKVTSEPLFIYSWMSGIVSGDPDFKETEWTSWHPWAQKGDDGHPFASMASPGNGRSHPVNQYDEPIISVIIPVGPGHQEYLINALDSLESQTFRKWEAIVVVDNAFHHEDKVYNKLYKNYPWVKFIFNVDEEQLGPGCARNKGVEVARAPFLVFLDADDYLMPEALQKMVDAWGKSNTIIYTDYVGIANVEDVTKLAPNLQSSIRYRKGTKTVIGYRAADYDCHRAVSQPFELRNGHPYIWCNVTALIPKIWHDEIGGFDEELWSWEDVDYHWRMAKAGKCYTRIEEELLVYNFTTGSRRQEGLQDFPKLLEYLSEKHKEIEVVGCGCSGAKSKTSTIGNGELAAGMNDADYIMIVYSSTSDHKVVGTATKKSYGYRSSGDVFLVHKADAAAQPQHFKELIVESPPIPETTSVEPEPISEPEVIEAPEPISIQDILIPSDDFRDFVGSIYYNRICKFAVDAEISCLSELSAMSYDDLIAVKGIGPVIARKITEWNSTLNSVQLQQNHRLFIVE